MSAALLLVNEPVRHLDEAVLPAGLLKERTRRLTPDTVGMPSGGSVVYWMQRDVRTSDNAALILASHLAQQSQRPLHVVYALPPPSIASPATSDDDDVEVPPPDLVDLPMTRRHADFLLGGLAEVHQELAQQKIPLHMVLADSHDQVGEAVCATLTGTCGATTVVTDFSPIRHVRQWMELQALPLLTNASIPLYQVDAHNIVPVWTASPKREVGARTLRSKINKVINEYLTDLPAYEPDKLVNGKAAKKDALVLPSFERAAYEDYLKLDESVPAVDWAVPGTKAGMAQYDYFVKHSLTKYDTLRNNPTHEKICSNLSPWINHGHISFQRIARLTKKLNKYANGTASFLEEGIIRRELSDNYVYYTPNDYDALTAAAGWAQETLATHASDAREYVYSRQELEEGKTHDDLWNAAQLQVVQEGGMHGFLRMYWCKKVLEWTPSPEVALQTTQYFNDKYALDGRDPNGFVGVAWSIMGIHDQGWKEREVFGKIRFMNYAGCKRKFKVDAFVARYPEAARNVPGSSNKRAAFFSSTKKKKKQKP
jgi:deoxyribodipyrimidine photo-lyase